MLISPTDIAPVLKSLIETCRDGQEGFKSASEALNKNEKLRTFLASCADQRAKFARELESELQKLGEPYQNKNGSISGSLHRGWIHLKGSLANHDTHAILAECERGEDIAMKEYKKALASGLPALLNGVVERQFREVSVIHNSVREARDSHPALTDSSAAFVNDLGHKSRQLANNAGQATSRAVKHGVTYARKNPVPMVVTAFGLGFLIALCFRFYKKHEEEQQRPLRRFSRAFDNAKDYARSESSDVQESLKPLIKALRTRYNDSSKSMGKAYNKTSKAVKNAVHDLSDNVDLEGWVKPAVKKVRRFF